MEGEDCTYASVRCCGICDHCQPKDVYDEDGQLSCEAMGLCDELDAIVWFDTPAGDCDSWMGWRDD